MNDFEGLLANNYGFKPQGKAAPMAASKGTSNPNPTSSPNFDLGSRGSFRSTKTSDSFTGSFANDHDSLHRSMSSHENREFGGLDDLLGGSARFSRKSESRGGDSDVNLDSLFHGSSNSGQPASSLPVYDKPVYDDDIFDGIPGLRSSSKVQYDDVFSSMSSPPKADSAFDDLLGGFGKSDGIPKSTGGKGTQSKEKDIPAFDDLIPGFRGSSPPGDRSTSGASWSSEPASVKTSSKPVEDPFGSLRQQTDPHEEVSDIGNLKNPKFDGYPSSEANDRAFDDVDPFASLGKSVPAFTSEGSNRGKARSPPRVDGNASGPQSSNSKETIEKSSGRTSGHPLKKDTSAKNDRQFDQPVFDMPTVSTNSHKFVPQSTSPPASKDANVMADTPRFQDNVESDEVWLTVSEIPLFTQPTVAPPPSRPPPPIPQQVPKEGMGPYGSRSSKMNANDFSSFPNSTHHFQIPKSASASMRDQVVSSVDELEEFAMGRNQSNADEQVNGLSNEELEMNSAAAAMKEAMDRAEAKFKHAKEVRERESTRTSRSKEAVYWDRDEKAMRNERVEDEESMDRERFQREREREREEKEKEKRRVEKERERARELEREREEKEKEQRRLEKERERARELEMERIKVRQAVERATREARERAAAEALLKAERAAVEKVNAEARERAERAAVQRAQAEARERAAAEARERAERVAAEAREKAEKAAAEAKEREARERASAARAEAEARSRAERVAVERAAAEARERAAAEARERAAAAARASQQKNDNDLESFFSMGTRASSAPRPRANPMDNFFDAQSPNRPESETTKPSSATSSSIRKASSTTNIVDDLSSIFGGPPSSGEFQEVDGESEERRRARLERHQRVQTRAAKALAEKNERDLQMQRDQAERHRIAETLDVEIKRWAAGKEGNLRALLSTLQYVLWPECGWQPVSLTEMVVPNAVKKVYRKATLCIHPDKVQQKGATLQQKYVAEKVFDILKEAWNKFNSEELF